MDGHAGRGGITVDQGQRHGRAGRHEAGNYRVLAIAAALSLPPADLSYRFAAALHGAQGLEEQNFTPGEWHKATARGQWAQWAEPATHVERLLTREADRSGWSRPAR